MSEELKDKKLKNLTKELLHQQIAESHQAIEYARKQITAFTEALQQQTGILNYATHLLSQFEIPNAPKPEDPKKPTLEVK